MADSLSRQERPDLLATPRTTRFPEYERAASDLFALAFRELMASHDPVLAMIPTVVTGDLPANAVATSDGVDSFRPMGLECTTVQPFDAVLNVDTDQWVDMIDHAAEQAVAALMPQIFSHINDIATATGNVVDARGPLTADTVLDMLDKMSISFDENGEPELPIMVVSPAGAEHVRKLPPLTPEQEARRQDILRRKKQEFDAKRRVRKLDQDS
jgi:hypothetical protein